MSGNGEEQMITSCHPQNGHLTRSLKYFDQNIFSTLRSSIPHPTQSHPIQSIHPLIAPRRYIRL